MSMTRHIILEGILAGLFAATIIYALVLYRRLNALRRRNESDDNPERLA